MEAIVFKNVFQISRIQVSHLKEMDICGDGVFFPAVQLLAQHSASPTVRSVDLFRAVEQQLEEQKRVVARQLLEAFDAGRTVLADRSAEVDAVSRRLLDLGNALQTLEPSERNLERFCSYCN